MRTKRLVSSGTVWVAVLLSTGLTLGANKALLHGVDYGDNTQNWHFEATQIQVALTTWKNQWPFAAVKKGDRKATAAMILADFGNVPNLAADDFFLYYYTGHGNFEVRLNMDGINEICALNTPAPAPDGGMMGNLPGKALNRNCDEMLSPHTPLNGVIYDDDFVGLFQANNVKDPKKLAIISSCFAAGMYNGHDVAGAGAGDLEQEGKTSMIAGINENELMNGAPKFNLALLDAFKPVLVGRAPNEKWRPNADENEPGNQDGDLTVQELWNYVLTKTPQNPMGAPRVGANNCGCPNIPAGGNPHMPPPRGMGGKFDPRFYDGGNVGAQVLAKEMPKADLADGDNDGLYDHQEAGFETDDADPDTDDDGASDYDELVHRGTDPLKKDTDEDGAEDQADCAPLDPAIDDDPPLEVTGVEFNPDGDLVWAAASLATAHDLLRGLLSGLPVGPGSGDESCLLSEEAVITATDPVIPPEGNGFWYLVRGVSECGLGTYGETSAGMENSSLTCPP